MGENASISSFTDRKRMQKLAYLIEAFDIRLGYNFNWYLYGPYSPQLTKDLYERHGSSLAGHDLEGWEKERLRKLASFLGRDILSADRLELLVSLQNIRRIGRKHGADEGDVLALLKQKKPFFSDTEIEEAWHKLETVEPYKGDRS
jgi:uncharacterized protein YwgA